jgi:uncharacterized membrane protein YfcA
MPQSKKRNHHHATAHDKPLTETAKPNKGSAVTVTVIFFAIIGLAIAYFTAGTDPLWLAVGAVAGAACGYFFGKQLNKSFSKK